MKSNFKEGLQKISQQFVMSRFRLAKGQGKESFPHTGKTLIVGKLLGTHISHIVGSSELLHLGDGRKLQKTILPGAKKKKERIQTALGVVGKCSTSANQKGWKRGLGEGPERNS